MEGRRVDRSLCLLTDINCRRKEIDKLWELCSESGFLCGPFDLALRTCFASLRQLFRVLVWP